MAARLRRVPTLSDLTAEVPHAVLMRSTSTLTTSSRRSVRPTPPDARTPADARTPPSMRNAVSFKQQDDEDAEEIYGAEPASPSEVAFRRANSDIDTGSSSSCHVDRQQAFSSQANLRRTPTQMLQASLAGPVDDADAAMIHEDHLTGLTRQGYKEDHLTRQAFSTAFASYIAGDIDHGYAESENIVVERRSHLIHLWRRGPIVNHNYDATGEPFILSPDSKVMIIWGIVMMICLLWSIIVAPLELILDVWTWAHVVDYFVTFLFMMDIPINFFVAIEQRGTSGVRMVFDISTLRSAYLSQWFIWDVICALPVDSLHRLTNKTKLRNYLKVFQLVRLFRISKLQRVHLLSRIDFTYAALTLLKCGLLSMVVSHWVACIWASLPAMERGPHGNLPDGYDEGTWLDLLLRTKLDLRTENIDSIHPMHVYMWSLYFSISLITTVGFGDVAPQTDLECGVCTGGIVVGSILWAYILSSLLDVLNRMNPHRLDFEKTMDELNRMIDDHNLPDALRNDVRHYFYECQDVWKLQRRGDLIGRMSRSLKGRVTLALNGEWIEKVTYIRSLFVRGIPGSTAFVVDISRKMIPRIFSPGEKLSTPVLYIVRKGLISGGTCLLGIGDVCGEDLVLFNPKNRFPFMLVALTMSATLALTRADILASMDKFPAQRKVIRRYVIWLAIKRGLARALHEASEDARLALQDEDDAGFASFPSEGTRSGSPSFNFFTSSKRVSQASAAMRNSRRNSERSVTQNASEKSEAEDRLSTVCNAGDVDPPVEEDDDPDWNSPKLANVVDLSNAVTRLTDTLADQREHLTEMINQYCLRQYAQGADFAAQVSEEPEASASLDADEEKQISDGNA